MFYQGDPGKLSWWKTNVPIQTIWSQSVKSELLFLESSFRLTERPPETFSQSESDLLLTESKLDCDNTWAFQQGCVLRGVLPRSCCCTPHVKKAFVALPIVNLQGVVIVFNNLWLVFSHPLVFSPNINITLEMASAASLRKDTQKTAITG